MLQSEPVEVSDVSQAVATHTVERFSSDILSSVSQCLSTEELSQVRNSRSRFVIAPFVQGHKH